MTEATWGEEAPNSGIDWRMSASLENVPRGESDLAEVTSLAGAVRAWRALDANHRSDARLTPERPVQIGDATRDVFDADEIAALADLLPLNDNRI